MFPRKLLKERQQEDVLHGDTPKFVTSAYKKKLQETAQWDAEDKLNEVIEAKTDVRGAGMMGFYSNLLTKNIAMGSNVESSAISAYTAGSERQKMKLESSGGGNAVKTGTRERDDNNTEEQRNVRQKTEEKSEDSSASTVPPPQTANSSAVQASTPYAELSNSAPGGKEIEVPVVSKEEKILSAKERYLARKSNKHQ